MDCPLPMVEGLEIAREILILNPSQFIVASNAFNIQGSIERKGREAGIRGFLNKPAQRDIVTQILIEAGFLLSE
jgi:hypothetical protein